MNNRSFALLVLGAGLSLRFGGEDKLASLLRGAPLAHHVLRATSALNWSEKRFVSREAGLWHEAYLQAGFTRLINFNPAQGLSTSLSLGIEGLAAEAHVLVCLADMPFITTAHLARLREASAQEPGSVFATAVASYRGPPAIFPVSVLKALDLKGDVGARPLLRQARLINTLAWEVSDIDDRETLIRTENINYSRQ